MLPGKITNLQIIGEVGKYRQLPVGPHIVFKPAQTVSLTCKAGPAPGFTLRSGSQIHPPEVSCGLEHSFCIANADLEVLASLNLRCQSQGSWMSEMC